MIASRPCRLLLVTAFAFLAAACSDDPETARQNFVKSGDAYAANGKHAEAIIEYRNALRFHQNDGNVHLKLAESSARTGDALEAVRGYVRAADLMPDNGPIQTKAATVLLLMGRFEDAKARAAKALALNPQDVPAMLVLANAMAGLKDLDGAVTQVEEALALDPASAGPKSLMGTLQLAQGDKAGAEKTLQQAAALAPNDANVQLVLGAFYWRTERQAEAEAAFQRAWQLDPKDLRTGRTMVAFLNATNRGKEAEPYLKAIAASGLPRHVLALADFYAVNGRTPEAAALLQPLLPDKTLGREAAVRLAAMDFEAGRRTEAFDRLAAILTQEPTHLQARLLNARFLAATGKLDAALAEARLAVDKHPGSAAAQYALGVLLTGTPDKDGAERAFTAVLAINPHAVSAQTRLAELSLRKGRVDTAAQYATEAVRGRPGDPEARTALARALIAKRDFVAAEREISSLTTQFPSSAEIQALSGVLQAHRGNAVAARAAFERALSLKPDLTPALAGLLTLDVRDRKVAASKARIEEQIAAHPNDAALLLLAATAYGAETDWARAESTLKKVIELSPGDPAGYSALGRAYLIQGKLDSARREFENMADRDPRSEIGPTMVGTIYHQQNQIDDTRRWYERALSANPRAAVAANNLAWMFAESKANLDNALQLALIAVEELPKNAAVHDTLGWVYYQKGLGSLAATAFKRSIELDPGVPTYHLHLGLAYALDGRKDLARTSLTQALRLSSNFPGADEARRTLAGL